MKHRFILLILATICASCGTKKTETAEVAAVPNQLTDQQKADGWKLLFDGQTMNGWRIFKNADNDSWEVAEGTLHCKPFNDADGAENKRADLMTTETYANFEFGFDWKISAQGNSGVIYRVTEEFDVPYATGPEYQVIDDVGYPGELKEENKSGGVFDMYIPQSKTMHPVGEWNASRLIVNGNHVEHWLNGGKVVEYDLGSDDWKKRVTASKWKDFPGYGLPASGYIDLQDHGNEVWFRSIMIKPL